MAGTKKNAFQINHEHLSLADLWSFYTSNQLLEISSQAEEAVLKCRNYLDAKIENQVDPIYGINTGFGSLYNISIEGHDLAALQENLVRSHACGVGEEVPLEIVRLMLLLKVQSLCYGHSGISLEVVHLLKDFYNHNILPVVYQQGSLGASGDLAPLAHIALALMGEGEVHYKGKRMPCAEALKKSGLQPVQLRSKEGLALLNGTQFMAAYMSHCIFKSLKSSYLSDLISCISLDGYDGRQEPFDALIHKVRPHAGQIKTAENVRGFLEGSALINRPKTHVQDPYSFRCIPQVHGASKDALDYVQKVLTAEINAVTDNPTIFPDEDKIISGGNFHGQNLAITADALAIAMAELGNISERRGYLMLGGHRGLPPFLVAKPGLNSGLMIAQYTAASIVSQNKQWCTPASVDSIVSSNGQEDHVSMGANAATKAARVVDNVETVLAIELITASQALYFREEKTSVFLQDFLENFRAHVPFIDKDRVLSKDIHRAKEFLQDVEVERELLFSE